MAGADKMTTQDNRKLHTVLARAQPARILTIGTEKKQDEGRVKESARRFQEKSRKDRRSMKLETIRLLILSTPKSKMTREEDGEWESPSREAQSPRTPLAGGRRIQTPILIFQDNQTLEERMRCLIKASNGGMDMSALPVLKKKLIN